MPHMVQPKVSAMLKKRISVSQKRQITIPIEFFNSIGIDKEVECYVQNNAIIIRLFVDKICLADALLFSHAQLSY
jgi:bifunctional DNA-binding transcriptional regulator/antitoxin component of YhaV-PrlF toxin-antitoxin module